MLETQYYYSSSSRVLLNKGKSAQVRPVQPVLSSNNYNALIDSAKNKVDLDGHEQFTSVLNEFYIRDKSRRGHLAFIRNAVEKMDDFGLEKDLVIYNKIIDIFPRGRFKSKRFLDRLWPVPHPQMELCLEILTKMEDQGVRPSKETYYLIKEIFGRPSLPIDKCGRIMYFFDKFADVDPYEIRSELPSDSVELSRLALIRMTGEDGQLMEIQVPDIGTTGGHLMGGISEAQIKRLEDLKTGRLSSGTFLHVEGPHRIWMKKAKHFYFTLRLLETRGEDVSQTTSSPAQSEGIILGVCMCQPYSRDKLQNWIGMLQDKYPNLRDSTILYDVADEHL